MIFKKLHLGSISFTPNTLTEISKHLEESYKDDDRLVIRNHSHQNNQKVHDLMNALALCHNVTPTIEGEERVLQASSPDEIALVKFVESVGLLLHERTLTTISLKTPIDTIENYEILSIFPFTSDTKRMGIIIQNIETQEITFFAKG
jgi:phospholipid-translocating ATPase